MDPQIVTTRETKVVGVSLDNAWQCPYLIMYAWIALSTRIGQVPCQVRPTTLYGIWDKDQATKQARYIVGVEVSEVPELPPGLVSVTIPARRYAVLPHDGNIGRIGETYDALRQHVVEDDPGNWDPTFEVYDTTQVITDDYHVMIHEPVP